MKKILRIYVPNPATSKDECIKDPDKILKALAAPVSDVDLDYDAGNRVIMGTSRELIGETILIGEYDLIVPAH